MLGDLDPSSFHKKKKNAFQKRESERHPVMTMLRMKCDDKITDNLSDKNYSIFNDDVIEKNLEDLENLSNLAKGNNIDDNNLNETDKNFVQKIYSSPNKINIMTEGLLSIKNNSSTTFFNLWSRFFNWSTDNFVILGGTFQI